MQKKKKVKQIVNDGTPSNTYFASTSRTSRPRTNSVTTRLLRYNVQLCAPAVECDKVIFTLIFREFSPPSIRKIILSYIINFAFNGTLNEMEY